MIFLDQAGNHPAFTVAKIVFAELAEDFRDGEFRRLFDGVVGVDEASLEQGGELSPHGGLARAHQADERNRPVEPGCKRVDAGHRGRCMRGLHCSAA